MPVLWSFMEFVKQPKSWKKRSWFDIIKLWSCIYLTVIIIGSIINILLYRFGVDTNPDLLRDFVVGEDIWKVFLVVVLVGPLIEEIIFRLPQKYHIRNISFVFAGLIYLAVSLIMDQKISDYLDMYGVDKSISFLLVLVFVTLIAIVLRYILKRYEDKLSQFWSRHAKMIVFISTAIFWLIHITNFWEGWKYRYLLWMMVIPQFLLGYMLSFVRWNRWRLAWRALHSIHNLVLFLPIVLLRQLLWSDINILIDHPEKSMELATKYPQLGIYGMVVLLFFTIVFVVSVVWWIEWIKYNSKNDLESVS